MEGTFIKTYEIDPAEDFLRKNDDLYKRKNRKKLMEYPYLSSRQVSIRKGTEIPISNLSNKQKRSCYVLGDCLDNSREA